VHRTHHAYSDTEKDPHSPINGRIYALIGWMFKVHQIRIPITLIRDVIKVRWLVKIDLYRIYIIYAIVLVSSVISLSMTLGLLMAMFTAFFIEMGINAFMHDPVKQESLNANEFLCWITAGGLKHKLHHENSGKATEADPGYYFIKLISINE
jgi:fatty-acid desaturase